MVGPRVYSVDEANELLPLIEATFVRLDELREELRTVKTKLTALEMIWGRELGSAQCPDHREGTALVTQLKQLEEAFNGALAELSRHSVSVKDVDEGLIDLFHVRDGRLVHLCWKRGETAFTAWHHVDAGYAGRQPL